MAQDGAPKRRLGRGLDALLGGRPQQDHEPAPVVIGEELPVLDTSSQPVTILRVDQIRRNPFQPRSEFDEHSLNELAKSIGLHGVLQPVLVRNTEKGYQLIAGERRWLAAQKAGLTEVPCRVMELADREVSEAAIEENLKRKDLNVLEKAQAFQDYVDRFGCTIEDLGKRLSMDRSTVSNMLRLLELPEPIRKLLHEEKITGGHARAMLPLEEADQLAICGRIQAESLSVRKTEQAVRSILRGEKADTIPIESAKKQTLPVERTSHIDSLEQQLRDVLGLKVQIKLKTSESGQVIIDFGSNGDFERITRFLRKAA
jgi:ParB family transcriptional regulator, chromosome partitioning protein